MIDIVNFFAGKINHLKVIVFCKLNPFSTFLTFEANATQVNEETKVTRKGWLIDNIRNNVLKLRKPNSYFIRNTQGYVSYFSILGKEPGLQQILFNTASQSFILAYKCR